MLATADEIKGSPCPRCRVPMMLGRVIPEPPDFDLYTFMCSECEYVKCVAVETSTMQRRQIHQQSEGEQITP
jgi:hypothetical protein